MSPDGIAPKPPSLGLSSRSRTIHISLLNFPRGRHPAIGPKRKSVGYCKVIIQMDSGGKFSESATQWAQFSIAATYGVERGGGRGVNFIYSRAYCVHPHASVIGFDLLWCLLAN